jgi:hypothetical protein
MLTCPGQLFNAVLLRQAALLGCLCLVITAMPRGASTQPKPPLRIRYEYAHIHRYIHTFTYAQAGCACGCLWCKARWRQVASNSAHSVGPMMLSAVSMASCTERAPSLAALLATSHLISIETSACTMTSPRTLALSAWRSLHVPATSIVPLCPSAEVRAVAGLLHMPLMLVMALMPPVPSLELRDVPGRDAAGVATCTWLGT